MTTPSLILGVIIATLYGVVFHFWRGGGPKRIILYLILSWAGFWVGHVAAGWLGWTFGRVGTLNLGLATIVSLLILLTGYWLSLVEIER